MVKSIIIIDSERENLRAIHDMFKGTHYDALFFDSAEEALIRLSDQPADLVIADIRMPGMNGVSFLRRVRDKYPETMRITLAVPSDSRSVMKALEENLARTYLMKPLDNRDLLHVVDRMFQLEAILKDRKILDLINTMDDLPTMPDLYQRIRTMISQDEDVEKIARLIESDQASCSRILRIANSSFFGNSTGSIQQAIMFIGLINVKNIVLSNSVFVMPGKGGKTVRTLWHNATLTNRYTSLFYENFLNRRIPNQYASAGLLHNIGIAILLHCHGSSYNALAVEDGTDTPALLQREQQEYGISHQELGGYLLNWWDMPLPIVEAALFHHTPMDPRIINRELVQAVHIANAMAWCKLNSQGLPDDRAPIFEACCQAMNIGSDAVQSFYGALGNEQDLWE